MVHGNIAKSIQKVFNIFGWYVYSYIRHDFGLGLVARFHGLAAWREWYCAGVGGVGHFIHIEAKALMAWLTFLFSAALIVFAGVKLTCYADKLSDALNLGKLWIGVLLLGFVTSLPEAITSLMAVMTLGADNLAVGNLLGSNVFNPILMLVLDLAYRKGSVTNAIHPNRSHTVSAFFVGVMTLGVMIEMFWCRQGVVPQLGFLSLGSCFLIVFYIGAMRYLGAIDGSAGKERLPLETSSTGLGGLLLKLGLCGGLVVVGALFLTQSADSLAQQTGLGRTFVGSLFLALATSLPEMVVTLSALRLGVLDLAVGNILGSNMTNLFILGICDAVGPGVLLADVEPTHLGTACLGFVLCAVVIGGIHWRHKKAFLNVGWDSWLLAVLFVGGTLALYWDILF